MGKSASCALLTWLLDHVPNNGCTSELFLFCERHFVANASFPQSMSSQCSIFWDLVCCLVVVAFQPCCNFRNYTLCICNQSYALYAAGRYHDLHIFDSNKLFRSSCNAAAFQPFHLNFVHREKATMTSRSLMKVLVLE